MGKKVIVVSVLVLIIAIIAIYKYRDKDVFKANEWHIYTIDSAGDVGRYSSIAIDGNNKVHMSYYDLTNKDLKYATNASGTWQTFTVDSYGDVGMCASIALGSTGKVHISYFDSFPNNNLKYATNASGAWQTFKIDSVGNVGWTSSIAIDSNDRAHITHYDLTNHLVKYTTNASGEWQTFTIYAREYSGPGARIAVDSADKVHIASDNSYNKILYATNASGTWQIFELGNPAEYGLVGKFIGDIAIDSNDKAHIAYSVSGPFPPGYQYSSLQYLKYTTNASGTWQDFYIDKSGDVGNYISIATGPQDKVHISYHDSYPNTNVKYATNVSGTWRTFTVVDTPYVEGWHTSIAIDLDGKAHISYWGDGTNLQYVTNAVE